MIHPTYEEATSEQPYYIKHCGIKGFAVKQLFEKGKPTHHIAYFLTCQEARTYVNWLNRKHKKRDLNECPRIDEIPPGLVTREDAAKILGFTNMQSVTKHNKRLRDLKPIGVRYRGCYILLYKREDVEALRFEPMPEGYITSEEAAKILNFPNYKSRCSILLRLRKLNIPCFWHEQHHSQWVWKREAVLAAKQAMENTILSNK